MYYSNCKMNKEINKMLRVYIYIYIGGADNLPHFCKKRRTKQMEICFYTETASACDLHFEPIFALMHYGPSELQQILLDAKSRFVSSFDM